MLGVSAYSLARKLHILYFTRKKLFEGIMKKRAQNLILHLLLQSEYFHIQGEIAGNSQKHSRKKFFSILQVIAYTFRC